MVKTVTFGEKQVQFSTSFAWAFAYKSQFGHDPAKIFMPAVQKIMLLGADQKAESEEAETEQVVILYEELGFTGIAQIAWSMAKLCDKSLPDPIAWIQSFGDDFEALTLVTELIPEAIDSVFSSKNLETPSPKDLKAEPEEKKKTTK